MDSVPRPDKGEPSPSPANTSQHLRREPRYGCPLTTNAQARDTGGEECREQTVWLANISQNGLAFYSGRSFVTGERLFLRIADLEPDRQGVMLQVMHVTHQPSGDWLVGCQLESPLSAEELRRCQDEAQGLG
jgi:hypothetical protein